MNRHLRAFILEAVLVVLIIVLSATAPHFLTSTNLLAILYSISIKGIIAFGMTMVIIAGEIDLSVGSMVAFSGCLVGLVALTLTGHYDGARDSFNLPEQWILNWNGSFWMAFVLSLNLAGVSLCFYKALGRKLPLAGVFRVLPWIVFGWCFTYLLLVFHYLGFGRWPTLPAFAVGIGAALGTGLWMGYLSGKLRSRFGVPTFISTLAWLTVLSGMAGKLNNGIPLVITQKEYGFLGAGEILHVRFPVIVLLVVFVVAHLVMNFTTFGRAIYATGGNEKAARLSGIHVARVKIGVMMIVSTLAVIAGVMLSAQVGSGQQNNGKGWELDVIASVIIGGASLSGGAGRIWSTFIGLVFMGVLLNGMTLLGDIDDNMQLIVRGVMILLAVLLNVALPAAKPGK